MYILQTRRKKNEKKNRRKGFGEKLTISNSRFAESHPFEGYVSIAKNTRVIQLYFLKKRKKKGNMKISSWHAIERAETTSTWVGGSVVTTGKRKGRLGVARVPLRCRLATLAI